MNLTHEELTRLKTLATLLAEPTELHAMTSHGQSVIDALRDMRKDLPQLCKRIDTLLEANAPATSANTGIS